MALVLKDRVKETTTTTGTGTVTLAGAVSGFQSFSAIGNANTTYYAIIGDTQWEVGVGTYTSSGTTLSRDTVLDSSNSGSLVNFSAGTKTVFCDYPAGKSVSTDSLASPPAIGSTAASTGAFTTLSASSTVSGAGFSTYLASPPAIGGTTPAAGTFTTLTSPILKSATGSATTGVSLDTPLGAQATIIDIGDGTRPLRLNGGSAGSVTTAGVSSSVGILQLSGSNSDVRTYTGGRGSTLQFNVLHTASAVNYVQVTGAATGSAPTISAQGSDATLNLNLASKGSGSNILFQINALNAFQVSGTGTVVNRLLARAAIAGAAPALEAVGTDTDIDLTLTPKGAGAVRFGTYTASVLTPTGYITIKDSGGTTRRLLVG